jgi:hypothetical protein
MRGDVEEEKEEEGEKVYGDSRKKMTHVMSKPNVGT